MNDETFDGFTKNISEVINGFYEDRFNYCIDNISNEASKIIFLDWWYGGCLWDNSEKAGARVKRYENVPDDIWDEAYGFIMETVSMGMG